MNTQIRPYREEHLLALCEVLLSVHDDDVPYPPPEAGRTQDTLSQWLSAGEPLARWVAVVDDAAAGHIQLDVPHPYLTTHLAGQRAADSVELLAQVEIGHLFLDPRYQGRGAGRALLETALGWCRARHLVAGLAVIDGSHAARALYRRSGMRECGSFTGIHGLNHVYLDRPVDG